MSAGRIPVEKKYYSIVEHYENCLEKHGDSHLGVDWPNKEDALKRYAIMHDLFRTEGGKKTSVLDFGCGAAHFLEYLLTAAPGTFRYTGLDISEKFIQLCTKKFPEVHFICADVLEKPESIGMYDYIVLNGVFTEKRGLTYDEMLNYFEKLTSRIWNYCSEGMAFNLMSKHVDWEREDLFHLSFDTLADIVQKNLGRNYTIRNDYGLYEYTCYVYKNPVKWPK